MALTLSYDAVVIGAGAGGAAAAWRLCDHGLHVLLLEAGPRFAPAQDYKLHQPDWERQGFPVRPGSQGAVSFGEFSLLDANEKDLRSWNRVTGPLVRGARRETMGGYVHVRGVGGSTLHFTGESHRLHPAALRLKTQHGAGFDWPLGYDELEPYYVLCEQLIGVAGPDAQGDRWRSAPFPLPPHPFSPASQRLADAGKRLGMHWQANSRAALSRPYDGRPACNYCANCQRGCPIGDKGSADVTFIRRAERSGKLTIKPDSQVTHIETSKAGKIVALTYVESGQTHRQETPLLIIAAGAVQTPRLLLANASAAHPTGLANSSGTVGRNFMETLFWSSTGLLPGLAQSHAGLPADAICWDFNAPDSIEGITGGCRFYSNVHEAGFVGPIAYANRAIAGFGHRLKSTLRSTFGSAISVGAIGEFLPNADSFITLDATQRDSYGVPLPKIHSVLGEENTRRLRFMAATSRQLLKEAGVTELVEEISTWDSFASTHVFGTCKMGASPEDSVVDAVGRTHDHPNLYLTDASVFPSTGGGEAPSLTIQALAVRTADAIVHHRQ